MFNTATDFFNNNKTAMKKVMAFCPAGTVKVTLQTGLVLRYCFAIAIMPLLNYSAKKRIKKLTDNDLHHNYQFDKI